MTLMDPRFERVCRAVCAREMGGLCWSVGEHIGCKVGRGEPPAWQNCKASVDQLWLANTSAVAQAAIDAILEEG